MAKKKQNLSPEELLAQALVPESEWPYKVPENWVWVRLGAISKIVTGGTPSKNNSCFYGGTFPFIKPSDLDQGRSVITATEYLSDEGKAKSRVIPQGATSVCCIGTIGKAGYLEVEATTNQQINSLIPMCNNLFTYYYCNTTDFTQLLQEVASATTISIINKSKMSILPFPLPPLAEQQRIVDRIESLFAKLDQSKELIQSALDSFENRKAAILHKAFSGELTKKWREENGIGLDSWEEKKISEVCKINPPKVDVNSLDNNLSVSFIPMSAVSDVYGIVELETQRLLGAVRRGYTNFCEGDIIFAKITPCMENGKIAIIGTLHNGVGYGSTEFHVFRCQSKLYNRYLYHILRSNSFREKASAVMTGAVGQQRVPRSFIENYSVCIPSLEEQYKIVSIIDNILDCEYHAYDLLSLLDQIDLMKKSILARAFRGELSTNDKTEEYAMTLLKEIIETIDT